MILNIKDYIVSKVLPKYIVIDNQDVKTITIKDRYNNKIDISSKDKVIGNFDITQILEFDFDNLYCKQIGFILYITNTLNPSWEHNFLLACGGINTLIDTRNTTKIILSDGYSMINIDFIINSIELHYKYFHPKMLFGDIPLIPQTIHMIWLKGDEFNRGYVDNWANYHPTFTIYLWTDFEDLENLPDNVIVQSKDEIKFVLDHFIDYEIMINLYQNTSITGIKSDILRYLILYKYGGIYVDINDFECFRSIEPLTYQYEFVVGAETCYADQNDCIMVNNAFIASKPRHGILSRVIEFINRPRNIKYKVLDDYVCEVSGPILFREIVLGYFIDPTVKNKTKDIILPAVYLYPACFYDQKTDRHIISFKDERDKWLHTDSYCAHYSDHSYLF